MIKLCGTQKKRAGGGNMVSPTKRERPLGRPLEGEELGEDGLHYFFVQNGGSNVPRKGEISRGRGSGLSLTTSLGCSAG